MVKTRVFISHANKGDPAFKPVKAVCDELTARGFEAEFDREILQPSDDWYGRVNLAMAQCDAAILLIDREAAESEYVRHEASVLGTRWHTEQRMERPFVLFVAIVDPDPVINDGLGSAHLLQVFGRAPKLDRVQRWKPEDPTLLGNPDLAPLSKALVDAFVAVHGEPWSDDTPLALARHNLWQAFEQLGQRPDKAVTSAIGRIDDESEDLQRLKTDIAALPAHKHGAYIAFWLANQASRSAEQMATLMSGIGPYFKEADASSRKLFHDNLFALHSLWIANDNCPIGSCLRTGVGGVIALNGQATGVANDSYTVRLFPAHRMFPEKYEFTFIDEDEQDPVAIVDAIAGNWGLFDSVGLEPLSALSQKLVAKRLEQTRSVCVLPGCFAKPQFAPDLAALQNKFKGIVFLIPLGQAYETADINGAVARVLPPIDPTVEQENLFYWTMTKQAIT